MTWFADTLGPPEGGVVTIVDRPDKPLGRKGAGGCDAILCRFGLWCAVEITQVEPVKGMQGLCARLLTLKQKVEVFAQEERPGHMLNITVLAEDLPKSVQPGAFADQIIARLRTAPVNAPKRYRCEIDGVAVEYECYLPPEGKYDTVVMMVMSTNRDMDADLRESVRAAIVNNVREKLRAEKISGSTTVLVLDVREISQLTERRVAQAFAEVWPTVATDDIDEIWIARSSDHPIRFVPLKLGPRIYLANDESLQWLNENLMRAFSWQPKTPDTRVPGT